MSGDVGKSVSQRAQNMKPQSNLRKVAGSRTAVVVVVGALILAASLLYPWRSSKYETVFVSRLLSQSPRVVIHSSSPLAEPRDETCTHFTCFDVYKCGHAGPRVTVYIYPIFRYVDEHGNALVQQPSKEFMELLDEIEQSEFYTSDPTKACLFVPSLDLLNESNIKPRAVAQILHSLPHWNNGTNHVLFNMLPGTAPDYVEMLGVNTGRALIMGGGFSSWTYRRGYDVSIPVFNPARYSLKSSLSKRNRPWLVVASQPHVHFEFRSEIASLASEHAGVIQLGLCSHAWDPKNATVRCLGDKVFKYPNVLKEANFCFVIRAARLGQSGLSDALMANCIPVIIADSYVLPFSEVLDWKRVAFQMREDDLHSTVKVLQGVSELRIAEMREQCKLLWERYFSSMAHIGRTVLNILNDRIFPHVSRTYEDWNDHPPGLIPPSPFLFPTISPHGQGFTAVVLTYDRVNSLFKVIQQLSQVPSLVKIVVVWNNQKKKPPAASVWPKLNKPLKVIQTQANKLSNRFYPYKDIETEAVLAIDDDILMLTSDELEFGFEVWREFPDRIVGFPSRVHLWDNSTHQWKYESEWTNDVSMVLTGAAFYHKHYSYEYFERLPSAVRRWVDNHMNCEDIAMNFLVANISGKAPIKVAPRKKFKCPECARLDNLSNDLQHLAARSECVNIFTEAFGRMPLQTVEFRADPVLFKDNFPEKLKRFPNLGSL